MDKKGYIEKIKKIDNALAILQSKKNNLISEYIKSNTVFPNGTKVKVIDTITGKFEYGFVAGYGMRGNFDVAPVILKAGKNGNCLKTRLWFFTHRTRIEACQD